MYIKIEYRNGAEPRIYLGHQIVDASHFRYVAPWDVSVGIGIECDIYWSDNMSNSWSQRDAYATYCSLSTDSGSCPILFTIDTSSASYAMFDSYECRYYNRYIDFDVADLSSPAHRGVLCT